MNILNIWDILTDVLFLILLAWCSYTDLKRREISNIAVVLLMIIGIANLVFRVIKGENYFSFPVGIILVLPFFSGWFKKRIGGGDVKLIFCCGLYLGLWYMAVSLIAMLPVLLGILVYRKSTKEDFNTSFTLAPVISFGCLCAVLIKYLF